MSLRGCVAGCASSCSGAERVISWQAKESIKQPKTTPFIAYLRPHVHGHDPLILNPFFEMPTAPPTTPGPDDGTREALRAIRAALKRVVTELCPRLDEAHAIGLAAVRSLADTPTGAAVGGSGWTPAAEPAWCALERSLSDARETLSSMCDVMAMVRETVSACPAEEFGAAFAIPPRAGAPSSALDAYLLLGRLTRAHEDDLVAKEVIAADLRRGSVVLNSSDGAAGLAAFWDARVYIPSELSTARLGEAVGV